MPLDLRAAKSLFQKYGNVSSLKSPSRSFREKPSYHELRFCPVEPIAFRISDLQLVPGADPLSVAGKAGFSSADPV
jgi:hypothetical protein